MTMLESESVSSGGGGDGLNILQGRSAATLGLGWLIAITLCGGVSLFICIGFALAWHAQKRRTPLTITRTTASLPYEASGFTALLSGKPSTTRLTKRRMMIAPPRYPNDNNDNVDEDDDDDKTTLASRFSLKRIPSVPVLPPLPSYSTFRLWNPKRASYRRERGWLDEEAVAVAGGGQMLVSMRQRPGSGSGWAGQNPPVLPPVGHRAMRQGLKTKIQGKQQQQQQQQQAPAPPRHQEDAKQQQSTDADYDHIYDKHDQPHHHQQQQQKQQAEEEMTMPAMPGAVYGGESGAAQDFVRPAAAVLARHPTRTDSELRDILRSTEQRLREGDRSRSRSPEKRTPHSSPTKTSTPRSNTPGGRGASSARGSPVKYGGVTYSASGSGMGAREGSAASIGSAANSLIAHATEELQLPGGMGSPSRLRGHEWLAGDDAILQLTTPQMKQQKEDMERALHQQSPQRSAQRSPQRERSERRRSTDSDASSSLSTLYSVGDDVDDASIQAVVEGPDDPFVDRRGLPVLAPLRRTTTVSSETVSRRVDHRTMPSVHYNHNPSPPLRNPGRPQAHHQTHKSLDAQRFAGALPPPLQQQRGTEDVRPKSAAMYAGYASPEVSESSFTDMSVDSTTLSHGTSEDTTTAEDDEEEGFDVMARTPVRRRGSDASSSPFSEHDIVNMIIAAQSPQKSKSARALPTPPGLPTVVAPDGSIIPTALSPPPKSVARTLSLQQRSTSLARKESVTSSACSNNDNAPAPLPASRSGGSVVNGLSVSNTVAELRRMNSLVSNTSNNSLTSATAAGETSLLLPNLSDGRLPQLQSVRNAPRMGTRQYLNVGSGSKEKLSVVGGQKKSIGRPGGPRPRKGNGHVRANTTTTPVVTASATPERPAKNPRRSMGKVGSMVERYQKRDVVVTTTVEKEQDNGKENAGLGISRAPSTRQPPPAALQESRGATPTRDAAVLPPPAASSPASPSRAGTTGKRTRRILNNPVVRELAAAEQRRRNKDARGSVDSLGLYDKDGFLLPSPERELHKKLLRM